MRDTLIGLMRAGLRAADAGAALAQALPEPPSVRGQLFVLAAGKAAGPMAAAVEAAWGAHFGNRMAGFCVVPDGHGVALARLTLREASHPVPGGRSEAAGRRALEAAARLTTDDMLLALISGGASSLLCVPADGVTLADKQRMTRALLAAGLPIAAVNAARRRLSAIKGGKLLEAAMPASVITLLVSDVPGDDMTAIGSGPTLPASPEPDGLDALARAAGITLPPPAPAVEAALHHARIVLRPADMLRAVEIAARSRGFCVHVLGDGLEGDAEALATLHADTAAGVLSSGGASLILSGGEAAVRVTGRGCGGRNAHFLLALALALEERGVAAHALAIDSDGIDGNSPAAGAILSPQTLATAKNKGLDPLASLRACDSFHFWQSVASDVQTGPTRTNLNDLRIVIPVARF